MNLTEYQQFVISHAGNQTLTTAILGLAGEAGEIANQLEKHLAQGHPLDMDNLLIELGDTLWYSILLCRLVDLDPIFCNQHMVPNLDLASATHALMGLMCSASSAGINGRFTPYGQINAGESLDCLITLISYLGFTLPQVIDANVTKLRKRYPNGFSVEASINRTV